jgi:diguanylate cyclase (GGDEF)-like protein
MVLPGRPAGEAVTVAERLRPAIRAASIDGTAVTMSFGVASTAPGEPFEYGPLFHRAGAALYRAKRAGRDRVCLAGSDRAPLSALAA